MKKIGSNVTRAKVVSGLHSVSYKGLTKTVAFLSEREHQRDVGVHL